MDINNPFRKLNSPPVVIHHRRQAAPDSEIQSHAFVFCVLVVHVVPLDVRHHLQCQLVMVPEKEAPLATVGNLWSLLEYFDASACGPRAVRDMNILGMSGKWNAI